jgi:hypothetical protein
MTNWKAMTTQVEQIWEELIARGELPAYRRVDESHPFDFYVGLEAEKSRSLLFVSDQQPPIRPGHLRSIEINSQPRQDGRWSTVLRLTSPQLSRIFAAFCQDLADSARRCTSGQQIASFVAERMERWEMLFARAGRGLRDQELRGLVGELLFLEAIVCPQLDPAAAVAAWHGPLEADQDFHFVDRLVEVKSVGLGALRVHISSAEQLDVPNGDLHISVVVMEESGAESVGTRSVAAIISALNQRFSQSVEASMMFSERLALSGYVAGQDYDETRFKLHGFRHFRVHASFPALRRSSLPVAIGKLRYELDLARCLDSEVSTVL